MKIDEIRELAAIMNETGLTAIEIEECGARLKLKRELYAGAPRNCFGRTRAGSRSTRAGG